MDKILEMILGVIASNLGFLFKWAAGEIEDSESIWDNWALDVAVYASLLEPAPTKLKELVAKTETTIDDKILNAWLEFCRSYDEGDEEAMKDAIKKLGFEGVVKQGAKAPILNDYQEQNIRANKAVFSDALAQIEIGARVSFTPPSLLLWFSRPFFDLTYNKKIYRLVL